MKITCFFFFRCNIILPSRVSWRISYNWNYGMYNKNMLFTQKSKVMPWLKMTDELLWWSSGGELHGFDRKRERKILKKSIGNYYPQNWTGGDITKFVLWKHYIVCGYTYIYIYTYLANYIFIIFYLYI